MAKAGLCTFLNRGPVIPGQKWMARIAGLSPGLSPRGHLDLRMPVTSNPMDHLDITSMRESAAFQRASGFRQAWTMHSGTCHPYSLEAKPDPAHYPNAPLGVFNNDPLNNYYIEHFSITGMRVLQQMGDLAPEEVIIWNEANELNIIAPGDYCPPTDAAKGSALAPEVFGALLYQCIKRWRDPSIKTRIFRPGPFSLKLSMDTDPRSDWFLGYWQKAIDYVRSNGGGDLLLDGICLNMEGIVSSLSGAMYVAQTMRDVMSYGNWTGHLVISEVGAPAGNLDPVALAASYERLDKTMDWLYWYQGPVREPGSLTGYGAFDYTEEQGLFVPTTNTVLYPFLQKLYNA